MYPERVQVVKKNIWRPFQGLLAEFILNSQICKRRWSFECQCLKSGRKENAEV